MNFLDNLKLYFYSFSDNFLLGLSLFNFLIIILILIFSVIVRSLFAKIIVNKIKSFVLKTGNKIDDQLFNSLNSPLKLLPIIFAFLLIGIYVEFDTQFGLYLEKITSTLFTIFIFWFIHQLLDLILNTSKKFDKLFSKALTVWVSRSLKYLILILGAVAVLETWGIKIGPVIAGLGLFGVAVALGAQDLFKNLISGILIITENRFNINDVIEVPDVALGSVEHIGFRSTLIRKFDSTPISVPNYVFSDSSVINYSNRPHRRIRWIVGLTYEAKVNQLKSICTEIEGFIRKNDDFIVNENYNVFVRVEKFNDSSIDILVQTFTKTNDWSKYLRAKENLLFEIKTIVEKHNSSFAFPSQSIYIEKN